MSFNPFDLPGPQFLAFLAFLIGATAAAMLLLRRLVEGGATDTEQVIDDPHQIAYLRGGTKHAIQTAMVTLFDRGLLETNEDAHLKTVGKDPTFAGRDPLDRAILAECVDPGQRVLDLYQTDSILDQAEAIGDRLREAGLLPDDRQKGIRLLILAGALTLVWGATFIKLSIALARHHHNVLFLFLLAGAGSVLLWKLARPLRTAAGQKVFKSIQRRLADLNARRDDLEPNQPTADVALVIAAFGMSALPMWIAAPVQQLHLPEPNAILRRDSSGCSSCSSYSSGGSCGGGSSCGGSSCGGGCGGCGG